MRSKSIKCLGFTLVELLVTMAIAAILLGIAIPSFIDLIKNNRLTTITNTLVTSLSYARNEAVKRGSQVTMINKGDWSLGWTICVDVDNINSCADATDTILRTVEAIPDGYSISTSGNAYAAFMADGLLKGRDALTLTVCEGSTDATYRAVILNVIGRTRVEKGIEANPC